ncbi:hypothetical protein AWL63_01595 [Sphingomonas panacis]|uniref:Alpha/beta hydrolase fold-3 domain-containing protein n=1 Tax=Sphingomonas panacis TaxID=1560345 RepID=A0A1B3Z601_9SPHN|nr:alpha/beta hydrolase [Sphingomonas panacis]AOH82864.1 hypothetical protein AWL63_01595 [Sphingomonas panacis]
MTRTIDPDSQAILDFIIASGRPPIAEAGLEAARAGMRASRLLFGALPPPTRNRDVAASGPAGAIPIRLYRPLDAPVERPLPLLVYFHGGGWVLGDIETGDALCATLAQSVGIAVAAVDYRLAPEFPFPAGLEDCFAALDWLTAQAGDLGISAARVAVAGDSAGGNLAAVCALRARDRGEPLCAQILLYPVTDLTMTSDSYQRNASGYMLTAETMRWFRDQYLGDANALDWRVSPLHAERLDDVAPALIVTSGLDPLCDEGAAYAARLVTAGVQVRYLPYPRQLHGFALWGKTVRDAAAVLAQVADELRQRLL